MNRLSVSTWRRFIGIGALIALGIVTVWGWRIRTTPNTATTIVQRGDLPITVEALGQVQMLHSVPLAFPTSGRLITVTVQPGDIVSAGTVLAQLDTTELRLRRDEAAAALEAARATLDEAISGGTSAEIEAAQARVRQAELAYEVAAQRYENATDEDERDDAAIARESAYASLLEARAALNRLLDGAPPETRRRLEAQVEQARIRLELAEQALAAASLYAPFDGIVLEQLAQPAAFVGTGQPIFTFADPTTTRLVAQVDEQDINRLHIGQQADIRFDAFPSIPLTGTVEHIAPAPSAQRGSTLYDIIIAFTAPDTHPVRPGMNATITIATETLRNVLFIPLAAVQYAGPDTFVYRLNGRTVEMVRVRLGTDNGVSVEVVEGLEEGDRIFLEPPD
nr:efflux RND transporter periplasmic adaptor subunit [Ardenticatena sp.]